MVRASGAGLGEGCRCAAPRYHSHQSPLLLVYTTASKGMGVIIHQSVDSSISISPRSPPPPDPPLGSGRWAEVASIAADGLRARRQTPLTTLFTRDPVSPSALPPHAIRPADKSGGRVQLLEVAAEVTPPPTWVDSQVTLRF
ncbi:hypothetical protein E2C01_051743 [Portunus trituberculatus]|uniref:Uncharacterized protein n=1 Tax=Portunus trituberculatus TaxID=210409 RepID=A0A5B7GJP0_PORTR|nr:hypothetical protein [Portunus trituberculatus]